MTILPPQSEIEAGARLTIDLGAVAANWRMLAAKSQRTACGAVVKADAYGTGIAHAVPALAQAGCSTFFVAHLSEARAVRAVAPAARIYVLNGLPPGTCMTFGELDLRPVLGSMDEIAEWVAFLRGSGWRGGAALHVDTGMARLGVTMDEARDFAQFPDRPPLSLIMSHLACADDPAHPLNARQIEAFSEIRRLFPMTPASLANSSGLFLDQDISLDLARPGVALFGGNPTPRRRNPMRPVVKLEARIIQQRTVEPGETVGYGAAWTARRRSRIAVVNLGYADGFLRAGSATDDHPGSEVMIAGRRRPIVGRISMDLIAVDITGIADLDIRRGDYVEFLGDDITVDEVAAHAGTIGYEILTALGSRFHRTYRV